MVGVSSTFQRPIQSHKFTTKITSRLSHNWSPFGARPHPTSPEIHGSSPTAPVALELRDRPVGVLGADTSALSTPDSGAAALQGSFWDHPTHFGKIFWDHPTHFSQDLISLVPIKNYGRLWKYKDIWGVFPADFNHSSKSGCSKTVVGTSPHHWDFQPPARAAPVPPVTLAWATARCCALAARWRSNLGPTGPGSAPMEISRKWVPYR